MKNTINRSALFCASAILLIAILLAGCSNEFIYKNFVPKLPSQMTGATGTTPGTDTSLSGASPGAAKVDLYVMSQCPYGVQAEQEFKKVIDTLGADISVNVEYIGSGDANSLKSLHGQPEVDGDISQLCVKKYDPAKFWTFLDCQNQNPQGIPGNWESCAQKSGIDIEKVKTCLSGAEGKQLIVDSFKKSDVAGAQGSPTIVINSKQYSGKRDAKSVTRFVCNSMATPAPACASIPKPIEFDAIILTHPDCKTCDTSQIQSGVGEIFEGVKWKTVDVTTTEGKEIATAMGAETVPAFVFDPKMATTDEWTSTPNLQTAFELKAGKYKLLDRVVGATFFIDPVKRAEYDKKVKEAKDAANKALGIVKGDNKPQIDFFVMSFCPYGNQAEEAIAPVYDNLKDKAIFKPRYVIYSQYQGGAKEYCLDSGNLCSMHGVGELNQNIRELCVEKQLGTKAWFDFALAINKDCSAQNVETCWEGTAKRLNYDIAKIKDCQEKDGVAMMKAESELNKGFGIQGSPTILIDGDEFNGARSANGYQAALCKAFDEGKAPAECTKTLAEAATDSGNAAAGGCGQ